MSIIGVQISAAVHAAQHSGRVSDCVMCDYRAGDWDAALAKFRAQQAEYKRNRKRRSPTATGPRQGAG